MAEGANPGSPGNGEPSVEQNLKTVRERVAHAASRANRDPASITLVAATKTVSPEVLRRTYHAGARVFGENRLQEAQAKQEHLADLDGLAWHFIGRIQRRKIKEMVGRFDVIHSIESVPQAREVNARAAQHGIRQVMLLQVNIGGEDSKGGFSVPQVFAEMAELDALEHVAIRGLMTLPPWHPDPEAVRPYFRELRRVAERISGLALSRTTMADLSMGMSHDYGVAIEEGATMVRVGSALFGDRAATV